jgi:hypothetical protein
MILSSTSGGISVTGGFDPAGDYRAESISGSVDLTPLTGVTAELRTVSGSIVSDIEHRAEGGRGFWRSIVGDGASTFRANSTSGGLRLRAARPEDQVVEPPAPSAPTAPDFVAPAGTATDATATEAAAGEAPAGEAAQFIPAEASENWNPDETADVVSDPAEDDELAVLQALERGEIGVDEAAERLDRSRE